MTNSYNALIENIDRVITSIQGKIQNITSTITEKLQEIEGLKKELEDLRQNRKNEEIINRLRKEVAAKEAQLRTMKEQVQAKITETTNLINNINPKIDTNKLNTIFERLKNIDQKLGGPGGPGNSGNPGNSGKPPELPSPPQSPPNTQPNMSSNNTLYGRPTASTEAKKRKAYKPPEQKPKFRGGWLPSSTRSTRSTRKISRKSTKPKSKRRKTVGGKKTKRNHRKRKISSKKK